MVCRYSCLQGQWRRVANFNYDNPIIAGWDPPVILSLGGGLLLLASRYCLCAIWGSCSAASCRLPRVPSARSPSTRRSAFPLIAAKLTDGEINGLAAYYRAGFR